MMPSAVGGPETAAVAEQAHRADGARGADGVPSFTPRRRPPGPVGEITGQLPAEATRPVLDREGARRADLAAIHMAKAALHWDDSTYRDIMWAVCRVRSARDMDFTARKRFLDHLRKCQEQMNIKPRRGAPRDHRPWSPPLRALWSRWQQLADAGLVHERSRDALQAWVKRQTGVDRLEWLTTHQLDAVLGAAKLWLGRGL